MTRQYRARFYRTGTHGLVDERDLGVFTAANEAEARMRAARSMCQYPEGSNDFQFILNLITVKPV